MPVDFVARALSEMLKIFGALGVVNVFTLSMLFRSKVTLVGSSTSSGDISLTGYTENMARGFENPEFRTILCGVSLMLVFIRFFYGFMILLDGDYISSDSKKPINSLDFGLILFLLPTFAVMSVYAGTGDVDSYVYMFILLLLVDVVGIGLTVSQERAKQFDSVFDVERKSWAKINTITLAIVVLILLLSNGAKNTFHIAPSFLLEVLLIVICFISVLEIFENRSFYLRGETRGGDAPPEKDSSAK